MSVGDRVQEAFSKMEVSDFEGALFAICAAIDATATTEFGKSGRSSYKQFIHQNLGLITEIGFGGLRMLNLNIQFDHPKIKKDAKGLCSIQDILYHAVRCGLYHDAKLTDKVKFTDEHQTRVEKDRLILPSSLIYGFIIAVVVSPVNKSENCSKAFMMNIGDLHIPLSKLWGQRDNLLWLLDAINEANRLQQEAQSRKENI